MEGWQIENCVLYVCVAATVTGAYALGAGGHAWWALVMLLAANSPRRD